MIKTNSKAAKEAIRNYMVDCIKADIESREMTATDLKAETSEAAKSWRTSEADILANYSLVFDFVTYNRRQLIKAWLQETEQEADRYEDDQVNNLFVNLISRELPKVWAMI